MAPARANASDYVLNSCADAAPALLGRLHDSILDASSASASNTDCSMRPSRRQKGIDVVANRRIGHHGSEAGPHILGEVPRLIELVASRQIHHFAVNVAEARP